MVLRARCSRRTAMWGGLALLLAGCSGGQAGAVSYQAMVDGDGNRVSLSHDGDLLWLDVHSARGVGSALIYLVAPAPVTLQIRLHLAMLEHFRLWWAGQTVTTAGAAADPSSVRQWSRKGDQAATAVAPDAPEWLAIRRLGDGAGFVVTPPHAWQETQPMLFGIGWIDAYR